MSDDNNSSSADDKKQEDVQDPIKQLKGEFSRKHREQSELLNQLLTTQAQLQETLAKIAQPKQQAAASDEVNLDEIMYSDPKKYASIIKEQAKQEAIAAVREETSSQDSVKNAIAGLYNEYPELADNNSDLTKATVEILKNASDAQKRDPRTYEHAVMKAAQQHAITPKSQRKQPDPEDDFVAPSYTSPQARSKKRSTDQVVNANKDVAKAMGVDLNDAKTKERYINLLKSKGLA